MPRTHEHPHLYTNVYTLTNTPHTHRLKRELIKTHEYQEIQGYSHNEHISHPGLTLAFPYFYKFSSQVNFIAVQVLMTSDGPKAAVLNLWVVIPLGVE